MTDIITIEEGITDLRFVTKPHIIPYHYFMNNNNRVYVACQHDVSCKRGPVEKFWIAGVKINSKYNLLRLNIKIFFDIQTIVMYFGYPESYYIRVKKTKENTEVIHIGPSQEVDDSYIVQCLDSDIKGYLPNDIESEIMSNHKYDLSVLDDKYKKFIWYDTTVKQSKLEFNCDVCSKANDVGSKKCWWCERTFS